MALSFKRQADPQLGYAILGKLPGRADFVRINATHPVVQEFDELVAQSVEWANQSAAGAGFHDPALGTDFFYVSRDGRWVLIGVMQPSRDQAGRRYPLLAGVIAPLTALPPTPATLPLLLELFYAGLREQLASAVEHAVDLLACRQYLEAQVSSGGFLLSDCELASKLLERFQQRQPTVLLARLLDQGNAGALERLLVNTGFYVELLRRYSNPATHQLILFPLPPGKGEEALYQGCWLSIYAAYAAPMLKSALPSFFVQHRTGGMQLAVAPQRVPERFLASVFGAPLDPWSVLNVDHADPPWNSHRLYAETVYVLGRLLLDLQAPISSLLGPLSDIGLRLARTG